MSQPNRKHHTHSITAIVIALIACSPPPHCSAATLPSVSTSPSSATVGASTVDPFAAFVHTAQTQCTRQTIVPTQSPHRIELANCTTMPELRDDVFATFGATLHTLSIVDSDVSSIGAAALNGLRQVQTIRLSGNKLVRLEQWSAHYFNAVETFDVSANRIVDVAPNALRAYPNVLTLRMDGNRIERLPAAIFGGTSGLQHIDLGANRLAGELAAGLFAGLRRLQTLSLAGNRLTTLAAEAFAGCVELLELRLEGNALQRLDASAMMPLRKLQVLNVGANVLEVVERGTFEYLGRLRELDLSGNRLSVLAANWAKGLVMLEVSVVTMGWSRLFCVDVE